MESRPVVWSWQSKNMNAYIRNIEPQDNPAIAKIIRDTLEEFDAAEPGTVYFEPTTDHLFEMFQIERSLYFTAFIGKKMVGGGGIYPTAGLPEDTCELVKLYLIPEARSIGLGKKLLQKCIKIAIEMNYQKMYLESRKKMIMAIPLYEKFGFNHLQKPIGENQHFTCNIWMLKEL